MKKEGCGLRSSAIVDQSALASKLCERKCACKSPKVLQLPRGESSLSAAKCCRNLGPRDLSYFLKRQQAVRVHPASLEN